MIQDGNEQWMVSRVRFSIDVDGKHMGDFEAQLKQAVGDDYETGVIEVGPPVGYEGAFSHSSFAAEAEAYFRSLVGGSGSGIRVEGGGQIRMVNNRFVRERVARFEAQRK